MRDLLECVGGNDALEVLELDGVPGGHDVGVCVYQRGPRVLPPSCPHTVDLLDERLDLALLGLLVL